MRVRDLLFAKRLRKKQIPNPVKNQTGFGMAYFTFSAACKRFAALGEDDDAPHTKRLHAVGMLFGGDGVVGGRIK